MAPKIAIVPTPGSAPPTFCCSRRSARPMLAPAGCCGSGPSRPKPELRRICFAIGPLTMTAGNGPPEVACSWSKPSAARHASTAATSTGRYSGRPPAMASAIAQVSTVVTPPRGGNLPSTCVRGSVGALQYPVHALLRRRPQRQAVAPQVGEQQVVRLDERVLVGRALDLEHLGRRPPPARTPTSSPSARRRTRACAP